MQKTALIILAAGKGKRMNQDIPKVLTKLNGISLIENLLNTIKKIKKPKDVYIVIGFKGEDVIDKLGNEYNYILQKEQLGTGHAIKQCKEILKGKYDNYLILCGDLPFVSIETINKILEIHDKDNSIFTMATLKLNDFENINKNYYNFGRIIRDEKEEIVKLQEFKDASEEEKNIKEVNPSIYCIKDSWLWDNLDYINNNNNQKEYYITELVELSHKQGIKLNNLIVSNNLEMIGVNTQEELEIAKNIYNNIK